MNTNPSADRTVDRCPDCGAALNFTIPGFRPATQDERRRLTVSAIRALQLCTDPDCPGQQGTS